MMRRPDHDVVLCGKFAELGTLVKDILNYMPIGEDFGCGVGDSDDHAGGGLS